MENPLKNMMSMLTFPEMYISFSGLMSHHLSTVLRIIYTPEPKKHFKKLTTIGLIKIDVMSYYD